MLLLAFVSVFLFFQFSLVSLSFVQPIPNNMDQLVSCDNTHNSLNCRPPSIVWRNVRYEVGNCGSLGRKVILRQLNGHFECNTLNGVMGPRGVGKTTLLNCLSGNVAQCSRLDNQSEIYLYNPDNLSTSILLYYIQAETHLIAPENMTVGQIFQHAYRFKNGSIYESDILEEQYIARILADLCLDASILNRKFSFCSAGEQKRIAIGQELVSLRKPRLLFVDEPTKNIGRESAFKVIKCLNNLAQNYQMTVIVSAFELSSEVLNLFDKLYVLAKGGVCVYSGPPNLIASTLSNQLQVSLLPEESPINALLRISCKGAAEHNVILLSECFSSLEYSRTSQLSNAELFLPIECRRKFFLFNDFFHQFSRQFQINFLTNYRKILFVTFLYFAYFVLLASIFNSAMATATGCFLISKNSTKISHELENQILFKESLTYLCYSILYVGFIVTTSSAIWFGSSVEMFKNEHRNNWYSLGAFYWSSVLISLIEMTFFAILITTVSYFFSSQHAADQHSLNWTLFGYFTAFVFLLYIYRQSFGQLLGTILVDHRNYSIVICLIYFVFDFSINIFIITRNEKIDDNFLIIRITDLFSMKYVTNGFLYAIYGLDRCDALILYDTDTLQLYSIVSNVFNVKSNQVCSYVLLIMSYVCIVKSITFVYLYFKFGVGCNSWRRLKVSRETRLIPIDFSNVRVDSD